MPLKALLAVLQLTVVWIFFLGQSNQSHTLGRKAVLHVIGTHRFYQKKKHSSTALVAFLLDFLILFIQLSVKRRSSGC